MAPSPKLAARRETMLVLLDVGDKVGKEHGDDDFPDAPDWRELTIGCTRLASLEQLQRDYLVRWNEGVGALVEAFWEEVFQRQLDVPRKRDVVVDTLQRGRILDPGQFYELEDHFEELQTCGKITPEQADTLNKMLDRFDANEKNFQKVRSRF